MDVAADGHFAASHADDARDVALPDTSNDNFPAVTEAGPYSNCSANCICRTIDYCICVHCSWAAKGRRLLYAQATMKVKNDRSSNATPLLHVDVEIHVATLPRNTLGNRGYGMGEVKNLSALAFCELKR